MRPRAVRGLAGMCAVLALSGCSVVGGIRRDPPPPPPQPVPAASVLAAEPAPRPFRLRSAVAPVPAGYRQATVEFANLSDGAALFTRCRGDADCAAVLLVTADGGTSWQVRKHPQPLADSQQLYVGVDGTIVLLSEPYAYFVSTDHGVTFTKYPYGTVPPVPYRALAGPYEICCDADAVPTLRRVNGDRETPVPVPPPIPGRLAAVATGPGTPLWVASVDADRAATAFSADGRSWTEAGVPVASVSSVQLLRAGGDLWLVGAVDRQSFPALWRLVAGAWRRVDVRNAPATYQSAAALGGGLLAVSGTAGTGVVSATGLYVPTDWPARGFLRPLGDGGLELRDDVTGTFWLGQGSGARWNWTELDLRT
jgi:hypothetical protein